MKLKMYLTGTVLILAMAMTASGADITGKWVAEHPMVKELQTVFNFTVNGETLTGTIRSVGNNEDIANRLAKSMGETLSGKINILGSGGDIEISDGKIAGDDISFARVTMSSDGVREISRVLYRGKISGDEIVFTTETQLGPGIIAQGIGSAGSAPVGLQGYTLVAKREHIQQENKQEK